MTEVKCPRCGSDDVEDTSIWCNRCNEWVDQAEFESLEMERLRKENESLREQNKLLQTRLDIIHDRDLGRDKWN